MFNDSTPDPHTGFRAYVIVSVVAFVLVALYLGWVFYSRWEANRAIMNNAAEKRRRNDAEAVEAMGGNRFDILSFSADPASIHSGERSSLCYSVSNAKSVNLDPPAEPVWPAFYRCVNASPRATTTYTLTIEDGAGHTKTASVEVKVR
jgi:hypothetical protein